MVGKAAPGSPATIMVVQGSVAVTAVSLAPSRLANSMPLVTALAASSDPSVAIRICLYMRNSARLGQWLSIRLSAYQPPKWPACN